ncbi:predicted protein [Histoplasma capsulatum var. duboisii H88]|uniref:Predicted protein n=1 Tax=Ajellomyces capsulatus (strain H88) TaxID=544711 RepID=F0URT4_AJEC8|nr:predicted protein [Histoplasma capsulatum var. duboisii H88]
MALQPIPVHTTPSSTYTSFRLLVSPKGSSNKGLPLRDMAYHLTALPHPASPGAEDAVFSSPTLLSLISSCIHNLSGLGLDSVACTFLYPTFLLFTLTLVLRCADHTVSCPNAIQPPIAVSGANRVTPGGIARPVTPPPRSTNNQIAEDGAAEGNIRGLFWFFATKGIESQGSHEVPAPASPDGHVCNRQNPALIFSQSLRYPQILLLQDGRIYMAHCQGSGTAIRTTAAQLVSSYTRRLHWINTAGDFQGKPKPMILCIGIAAAAALEARAAPEPLMCSLPLISPGTMARYVCRFEHIGASGQRLASGLLRRTDGVTLDIGGNK